MSNRATIDGNHNIVIQDSHGSEIIINANDPDEIERKLKQLNQEQLIAIQNMLEAQTDFIFNHIKSVLKSLIPDSLIPKNLTSFKSISKEDIVGREEDLKTLRKRLLEDKKLSLINGMGGIGKTTLAAVYVEEFYDVYDHIAWLTIESSLEEAILANHDLLTNLKLQEMPSNELFSACLNRLRTMSSKQPGLLVLDNATQRLGKLYDALPKAPNWHVLVTSREIIEPFSVMELGFLTEKEAVLLFHKYNDKFTEEEIKSFVNEVEFHTLTIEILAKSAKKNRWEADTVRNAIIENAKAGISTSHSGYEKIDRIKVYLIQIFKLSNVDEKQEYVLKQFTALPNQWISYEQLYKLLQAEKLAWKDEFSGTLEDLYEKGYLQKDEPTDSYKMHPILVEALSPQLETTENDLKPLIESVFHLLSYDHAKDNPIEKFSFIPFGDAILERFPDSTTTNIAILQNNLALVYNELGKYEKAKDLLEKALESDIANYGKRHQSVALKQSNLATVYKESGEHKKAKDLLEKALDSDIANYGEKYPTVAVKWSNLAMIYHDLGKHEKAKDLLEKALESDIANYGEKHATVARNQSNLAIVYKALGKYEKSKDLLEKALGSNIANYGEKHPTVAVRWSNLAMVYHALGEYKKAKDLLEQALDSNIANYGENHITVTRNQSNLAQVYNDMGKSEKAKDLLEKALTSTITNFGEKHPNVAINQSHLASVYYGLGKYEKARDLLKKALDSDIDNYGENHPNVAINQSTLGLVYKDMGENEKAQELLEKALASTIINFGENHPNVAVQQTNLGLVYKALGEYKKARDLLEKALALGIANYGEKHPTVAIQQSNLATVYYALGEFEKTRSLFKRAYETFFHTLGEDHPKTKAVKSTLDKIERK